MGNETQHIPYEAYVATIWLPGIQTMVLRQRLHVLQIALEKVVLDVPRMHRRELEDRILDPI